MTRIPVAFTLLLATASLAQQPQRQQQQQQPFLTEIFPEQLEQQQLQFRQNQIQVQLQQVQQAIEARPQDPALRDSLLRQQDQFLRAVQDIQQQQLLLQQRIQERLNGVQAQPVQLIEVPQPIQVPVVQQPQPELQVPQTQEPSRKSPNAEGSCKTANGESGICRPLVSCLSFYAELPELKKQPCKLAVNEFGVCCPNKNRNPGIAYLPINFFVYFLISIFNTYFEMQIFYRPFIYRP